MRQFVKFELREESNATKKVEKQQNGGNHLDVSTASSDRQESGESASQEAELEAFLTEMTNDAARWVE